MDEKMLEKRNRNPWNPCPKNLVAAGDPHAAALLLPAARLTHRGTQRATCAGRSCESAGQCEQISGCRTECHSVWRESQASEMEKL